MYLVVTLPAAIAGACWLIVGFGAALAVMSPRIDDILSERIALSIVSIGAFGTAFRIARSGEITDGGLWLAVGLAGYVLSLIWKHWKRTPGGSRDKGSTA